jgi:hypothetical protein
MLHHLVFSATVLVAVSGLSSGEAAAQSVPDAPRTEPVARKHPLLPALQMAYDALDRLRGIDDYTCLLVKRERIDGQLSEYHYLEVKVRHEPFSVYVQFLAPDRLRGQQAVYIAGQNRDRILARTPVVGVVSLDPTSPRAMQGHRYPITEIGLLNLVRRLIQVGEEELQYGEIDVSFLDHARVNDRPCTIMRFEHPVPRREFRYHLAQVYVDEQYKLPIRYEAYTWPPAPGGDPVLLEEYTYLKLRFNVGLTDRDFRLAAP